MGEPIKTDGLTNTQIIGTQKEYLTSIQKQIRFLMSQHLQHKPCPNCGELHNLPEVARLEIDEFNFGSHDRGDRIGKCHKCNRTLIYTLPWPTGDWYWRLDPDEATITASEAVK